MITFKLTIFCTIRMSAYISCIEDVNTQQNSDFKLFLNFMYKNKK